MALEFILLRQNLSLWLFLCYSLIGFGQNTKTYRLSGHLLEKIIVEASDFIQVEVYTHQKDSVFVYWESDGEYAPYLDLQLIQKNQSFKISGYKSLWFPDYDDKLSAHKIIAQSLQLYMPAGRSLEVYTDKAAIEITGAYQSVSAQNISGNIRLLSFTGNAQILSFTGDIEIDVKQANITCDCPLAKTETGALYTVKLKTEHGQTKTVKNK